jgi:hypothetical protein
MRVALRIERSLDRVRVFLPLVAGAAALGQQLNALGHEAQGWLLRLVRDGNLEYRAHTGPQRGGRLARHVRNVVWGERGQRCGTEAWGAAQDEPSRFTGVHATKGSYCRESVVKGCARAGGGYDDEQEET